MLLKGPKWLRQTAAIAETANWLFLKLLIRNRSAARLFPGRVFREYAHLIESDQWRSGGIFDLLPELSKDDTRITLEHMEGRGVETSIQELAYLALATRALARTRIFEFGTFHGRTALNFALNSPEGCKVYTLDLPVDGQGPMAKPTNYADQSLMHRRSIGSAYEGRDVSERIQQLYGNSLDFDFSPFYGKVDLVFIDGGHSYEVARSDGDNALRMCRPGGIVIWHDFACYGDYNAVTRAALDTVPPGQLLQIENTQLAAYRKPLR